MNENTRKFDLNTSREHEIKRSLAMVYEALSEKGYNPINQLVGYILSEDPTYITTHKNARNIVSNIDRDELLQVMLKEFLAIE
ncbi:MAG: IreB family regulatory phosphoprotein [Clostridia bacterium]|nr:IreB family regulatory phosphoprotein [Clostridia bacterium]